jgi:squalene-hopene/tetraprenyl-beta-curcumene cyclase
MAGGADAVNSFTRFYLALLGQISYDRCPAVPPELVLLPGWSPIHLPHVGLVANHRRAAGDHVGQSPGAKLAGGTGNRRAVRPARSRVAGVPLSGIGRSSPVGFSWDNFFRQADRGLKWLERRRIRPLRRRALAARERWMTTRFAHSDGLGAIFPPIVWSIIALKCLGYPDDSVELRYNFDQLADS